MRKFLTAAVTYLWASKRHDSGLRQRKLIPGKASKEFLFVSNTLLVEKFQNRITFAMKKIQNDVVKPNNGTQNEYNPITQFFPLSKNINEMEHIIEMSRIFFSSSFSFKNFCKTNSHECQFR